MEIVFKFLTETLDGTTYVVVVIVAVILLFACIGFLAERSALKKNYMGKVPKLDSSISNLPITDDDTTITGIPTYQDNEVQDQNQNVDYTSFQQPVMQNQFTQQPIPNSTATSTNYQSSPYPENFQNSQNNVEPENFIQ